jgi:hypothetical protein
MEGLPRILAQTKRRNDPHRMRRDLRPASARKVAKAGNFLKFGNPYQITGAELPATLIPQRNTHFPISLANMKRTQRTNFTSCCLISASRIQTTNPHQNLPVKTDAVGGMCSGEQSCIWKSPFDQPFSPRGNRHLNRRLKAG